MVWVKEKNRFEMAFQKALDCAATDSGRLPTSLRRLTFDDVEIRSHVFASFLQKLLGLSGDDACSFVVLRPDPVYYFHHFFGEYPVVEVRRGMPTKDYLALLNDGPPDSKADALGIVASECVFVPPSLRWFIHVLRSARNDGGHLWVPSEWVGDVVAIYPHLTVAEAV